MTLPPNMNGADFARALKEFEAALGAEWVFSSAEDLAAYGDAYSPFSVEPPLQKLASAAVAPASVEQVQAVVRIANGYRLPLYTFSTGRNLGYGGTSPTQTGCVIVDLKRMNRVLEVNEEGAYVVCEPGVNFLDLYRHLEQNGSPFMVSTPEPGWGSPVGNALDRGVSFIMGDNFGAARGIEVVLPNGELLRTGMGAIGDGHLWHEFPYGYGPNINGLFSQSNFGIVTKMGFNLARKPEKMATFRVSSGRSKDLYELVAIVQALRDEGHCYLTDVASPIRSVMVPPGQSAPEPLKQAMALIARRDGGSHEEWDRLGAAAKMPVSVVTGCVRGPAGIVDATLDYARDQFARVSGSTFDIQEEHSWPLDLDNIPPDHRPRLGVPSLWPFSSLAMGDTRRGMYFFSPVCRATAQDLFALRQTVREVVLDHAPEPMRGPFLAWSMTNTVYPKAYIFTFPFAITDNIEMNRKGRDLFKRLVETCGAKGYGEYRAHVAFQSEVMDQYAFGDNVLRRFCEAIKDAVDPNGIIAPGKSGIWPRAMRARPGQGEQA